MNVPAFASTLVIGVLLLNVGKLYAQPLLREGQKVRIVRSGTQVVTGLIARVTADSVFLAPDANQDPVALAFSDMRRLQVSRGRSALAGGGRGLLFGAVVGLVFGAVGESSAAELDAPAGAIALTGVVLGMGAGGAIGLATGAERWESVRVGPTVGQRNGLQFGVRF